MDGWGFVQRLSLLTASKKIVWIAKHEPSRGHPNDFETKLEDGTVVRVTAMADYTTDKFWEDPVLHFTCWGRQGIFHPKELARLPAKEARMLFNLITAQVKETGLVERAGGLRINVRRAKEPGHERILSGL